MASALRRLHAESQRGMDETGCQESDRRRRRIPECKRYLLMDRDEKFSRAFRDVLEGQGVNAVRLPPRSPDLNAHIERFFLSLKSEGLDRMIFFGEKMLRNAVQHFLNHYQAERNHQGLDNELIEPGNEVGAASGTIECRERLGGLLRYYHRDAA